MCVKKSCVCVHTRARTHMHTCMWVPIEARSWHWSSKADLVLGTELRSYVRAASAPNQ